MVDRINRTISFGEFQLDADRRLLMRDGEVIPLKAKAIDLLLVLIERRGEIVSKNELLDIVWESQFVEENNLTVHMAALRRALGEKKNEHQYIVTVSGKGYRFIAPVIEPVDEPTEVVIERRSLSRIVVEEEETSEFDDDPGRPHAIRGARRTFTTAAGIAAVLLIVILAGGWIYSSRKPAADSTSTLPRFSASVFATAGGIPDRVAIAPDGKTIAYVERRQGQYSLRLGEPEGNNSVEIIPPADRLYRYLAFSPDGRHIYFTARDASHNDAGLMRVSKLGGAIQDLVQGVHSSFSLSPDGRTIAYFRSDDDNDIASLMTADASTGKNERELTRMGVDRETGGGISWSPDGRFIAYATPADGGYRLSVLDSNDNSVKPLGETVANRIVNVAWLGDGSGVLSIRNMDPHPNDGQVWFVSYPSGEARLVTEETQTYSFGSLSVSADNQLAILQTRSDPYIAVAAAGDLTNSKPIVTGTRPRGEGMNGVFVAPDGKLLFTAVVNDSRTIWEMNLDGSDQRQLTATQKDSGDEQPSVTPDNRHIIFQSTRSGALEIWRANRDGRDLRQLTSGGGNWQPILTPDGASIVYASLRDGKNGLKRISIDGGESVTITDEQSSWPDVSPDGRLIAYSHGPSSRNPSREIRVIPIEGGAPVHSFEVPLAAVLYNRLRWSKDGRSILYKDHTQGLWRQEISKDKPEYLPAPTDMRIYHFAFSADGNLVFSGGSQMREIVLMEPSS